MIFAQNRSKVDENSSKFEEILQNLQKTCAFGRNVVHKSLFHVPTDNINKGVIAKNVNKNSRKHIIVTPYFTLTANNINKGFKFTRASATCAFG